MDSKVLERGSSVPTNVPNELIRDVVSTRLTKILMLLGRLQPGYNPRHLPLTVSPVLFLIGQLERLERNSAAFHDIIREHIELRLQSGVFPISDSLRLDPNCKGLRVMLFELVNTLVKAFCEEEQKFLAGMSPQVPHMVRFSLLARAEKNCELLATLCSAENSLLLNRLKQWCSSKMLSYQ
ncbi:MAG: hypothetical protein ACXVP0_02185 [Bacteroidia bacterium]